MSTLLERLAQVARRATRGPVLATKAAAPAFALYAEGRASWTPRDPAALARAGYQANPVVHRAVRLVAESAAREERRREAERRGGGMSIWPSLCTGSLRSPRAEGSGHRGSGLPPPGYGHKAPGAPTRFRAKVVVWCSVEPAAAPALIFFLPLTPAA